MRPCCPLRGDVAFALDFCTGERRKDLQFSERISRVRLPDSSSSISCVISIGRVQAVDELAKVEKQTKSFAGPQ